MDDFIFDDGGGRGGALGNYQKRIKLQKRTHIKQIEKKLLHGLTLEKKILPQKNCPALLLHLSPQKYNAQHVQKDLLCHVSWKILGIIQIRAMQLRRSIFRHCKSHKEIIFPPF